MRDLPRFFAEPGLKFAGAEPGVAAPEHGFVDGAIYQGGCLTELERLLKVASDEVLYVGESHSKRLHGTLTRHFQSWTGYQAGTLYSRYRVEVAVVALDAASSEVIATQKALIRALDPTDNVHHRAWAEAEDDEPTDPSEFQDDW